MLRLLLSATILISLCTGNAPTCHSSSKRPSVAGKINPDPAYQSKVYLLKPARFADIAQSYAAQVVDSAALSSEGYFRFKTAYDPGLYLLAVQRLGSRFSNYLEDANPRSANYFPIILNANDKISFEGSADALLATAQLANPDAVNQAMLNLRDIRLRGFGAHEALLLPDSTHNEEMLIPRADALARFREPLMAFADTCNLLEAAVLAIRWVSPEADYERVPEFMARQCEKWSKARPEHAWTSAICAIGDKSKLPIMIGDVVPDAALPMAGGDTLALHSLLGKKCTILDIWASWCAPCRRENREVLLPLWQKYEQRGLQIVGYAIDGSEKPWKAAILRDGAAWPHASHLTGDATPFLDALRISTIPANLILDAEGRVVAKNLHGAALEQFLENYFQ